MSDPVFDVEQVNVFNVRLDMQALGILEKAMAFYSERAILQDGDPARDLSRKLTSMLMKMAVTRNAEEAPPVVSLPPAKEEVAEVTLPEEGPGERTEGGRLTPEEITAIEAADSPPPTSAPDPLDSPVEGSQDVKIEEPPLEDQLDEMIDGGGV